MLNRIKVRSKLLLLVIVPLFALGAFAAIGVTERLDSSEFFAREERIAALADAGADLALAVQVEQIRALETAAGGEADLAAVRAATDAAADRWLRSAAVASPDLGPAATEQLDTFADVVSQSREPGGGRDTAAITDELLAVGQGIDSVTVELSTEARDIDLYRALVDYLQLKQVQNGIAEVTAIGASSIGSREIATGDFALLRAADSAIESGIQQFTSFAEQAHVDRLQGLVDSGRLAPLTSSDPILELQFFLNRPDPEAGFVEWLAAGEDRLRAVHEVSSNLLQSTTLSAGLSAVDASDQAEQFFLLAGVTVVSVLMLAVLISRAISSPLRVLTTNAERLASDELPALVESLRQGSTGPTVGLTPIDTRGRDEVAQLATAISEIQDVTVAVAAEQGELLRRGISDMFVNLARRNQSLLDRQIEFIDQLEAREEDADTLENLFRLDHLATRMRRNAESLLVLAGVESSRRRGSPVELIDVVRVAMGEIEDFSRVRMLSIEPATVAATVAVDLAHLLSELMENASQFSPPDTPVEVVGQRTDDGSYRLTVSDRGIGLPPEQLREANRTLANPPVVGLDMGRSLGFTVVSRLAHRLGISTRLTPSPHGGVTAVVAIPAEMIGVVVEPEERAPETEVATRLTPAETGSVAADPEAPAESAAPPVPDGPSRVASSPSVEQTQALPVLDRDNSRDDMFDVFGPAPQSCASDAAEEPDLFAPLDDAASEAHPSGLPRRKPRQPRSEAGPPDGRASPESPMSPPGSGPRPTVPEADPAFEPLVTAPSAPARRLPPVPPLVTAAPQKSADDQGASPAVAVRADVEPEITSAGLVRRTPRPRGQSSEASGDGPETGAARSPDEVRQMLSRYRSGLRKGRESNTS